MEKGNIDGTNGDLSEGRDGVPAVGSWRGGDDRRKSSSVPLLLFPRAVRDRVSGGESRKSREDQEDGGGGKHLVRKASEKAGKRIEGAEGRAGGCLREGPAKSVRVTGNGDRHLYEAACGDGTAIDEKLRCLRSSPLYRSIELEVVLGRADTASVGLKKGGAKESAIRVSLKNTSSKENERRVEALRTA